jgi:hypothetical protein
VFFTLFLFMLLHLDLHFRNLLLREAELRTRCHLFQLANEARKTVSVLEPPSFHSFNSSEQEQSGWRVCLFSV